MAASFTRKCRNVPPPIEVFSPLISPQFTEPAVQLAASVAFTSSATKNEAPLNVGLSLNLSFGYPKHTDVTAAPPGSLHRQAFAGVQTLSEVTLASCASHFTSSAA